MQSATRSEQPQSPTSPSLWSAFSALIGRDVSLAVRDGGSAGTALGFYLIVVALMPLGLGPDLQLLARIAPGILWIGLLLAALLATSRLFEADHDDGSLDVFAAGPLPLEAVALAKIVAHWLTIAVPLIIMAPVLGLMLNLDLTAFGILTATMLLGTPAISAIGCIGAALTLRSRKGALLVALLVLPLYIPTLIFGIAAVAGHQTGPAGAAVSPVLMLSAISLASLVLAPVATAAALRAQVG
jgi:heme exporter protein B